MEKPLLIWGSGAIGGTIGAYLARSGSDVLMVDMVAEHVEAMNRKGLDQRAGRRIHKSDPRRDTE